MVMVMKRDVILDKFSKLRFCVLWPGNWEDVGFTERPIWVNAEGYGYYYDDEPCLFDVVEDVTPDVYEMIKNKAECGELTADYIKTTPFAKLNTRDDEHCELLLEAFAYLPNEINGTIFCGYTENGWAFFSSEEELIAAFEKNSNDYNFGHKWEDLDDHLLEEWYKRIFSPDQFFDLPMTLAIATT